MTPQHSQFLFSFTSSSNVSSVFSDLSAFSSSSVLSFCFKFLIAQNTEETLEDKVNENDIKTENVEESLEPVEVDKAG